MFPNEKIYEMFLSGKNTPNRRNEFPLPPPFFLKCNQVCEFFLKKFYFPLEEIQKALKTQRKIYMTS